MSNLVHEQLRKEFSDIISKWLDTTEAKVNASHDAEGKKDIRAAKSLYYLDYMAPLIDELADKAYVFIEEQPHAKP